METAPNNSSVYNLSGDELISLMQIAETAIEISNQQVKIMDGGGIASIRNPDSVKFMKDFGFATKFSLSAGLKACLDVMK
jgi:nucleoside-diphosphate-sugar epimerase